MTFLKEKDVLRWNEEQLEERKGVPNLFVSMVESSNGDSRNLELQIMRKRKIENWKIVGENGKKIHEYIVFTDKQMNNLLIQLKQKYCSDKAHTYSEQYGEAKMGIKSSNKVFDPVELESMLVNYIMTFPYGYIEINDLFVSVPDMEKFRGESDEHANNKLVKYISTTFEKRILLNSIHKEKDVKRLMVEGETYYVKQNDMETVSFEDITLVQKTSDSGSDEPLMFDDIITDNHITYNYNKRKEYTYMLENYRDVLTDNQLERYDQIVAAVESGEVCIEDLFHPIYKNQLNIEAVGKVLFPEKENNYRQPAVRNMLKSMKARMDKELHNSGFKDDKIRSDYAPFPSLPAEENKKFKEYKIDSKYLSRDYYINDLHTRANGESLVTYYVDEQIIPPHEIVHIVNEKISVGDLIKKYSLDKRLASSLDGAVYSYLPDEHGEKEISGKKYRLVERVFVIKEGTEYSYIDERNMEKLIHKW